MKTFLPLLFFYLVCTLFSLSCNQHKQSQQDKIDTLAVNAAGIVMDNDTLATVFAAYTQVKDNLVKSDSLGVQSAAEKLAESLKTIHGCEEMSDLSKAISETISLHQQRMAFATISRDLIAMYKSGPLEVGKIYVIHCPMFNNKKGADWLALSSQIENPYFGEKMLTCGEVVEEIN